MNGSICIYPSLAGAAQIARRRRDLVEYEMYFGQLDIVLVGSIVEAEVAIIVIGIAWLRKAVQ